MDVYVVVATITLVLLIAGCLAVGLSLVALLQCVKKLGDQVERHNRFIESLGTAWHEMAESIERSTMPRKVRLDPQESSVPAREVADQDSREMRPLRSADGGEVQVAIDESDVVSDHVDRERREPF